MHSRPLACMRLELNKDRIATSAKLRHCWEKRSDDNSRAVDVLHHNQREWHSVGGPDPEELFHPSATDLERAKDACAALERKRECNNKSDGFDLFVEEITKAVGTLKSLEWEDIRAERFSLTPPALFSDLVRTAETLLHRQAAEMVRREEWLAKAVEPLAAEEAEVQVKGPSVDKYGLDLDEFKMKTGRKPKRGWNKACQIAGWMHIDEMRSLLELHYDDVHFERWKKTRQGEYKVFSSVAQAHRKKLNQRLALPRAVKDILQKPQNEDGMDRLERLRAAIMLETEGEEWLLLSQDEMDELATAVEKCPRETFTDEVGEGSSRLPAGARVQVDGAQTRAAVVTSLRSLGNDWLRVLMRPFGTRRAPLVDDFYKKTLSKKPVAEIDLPKEKILDNMLLCLFDALFLKQSDHWSRTGVANTPADETPELAKWFMKGQQVGSKPIFDGICSMCGTLLHGAVGQNNALSVSYTHLRAHET